jgi:hypothetical protein
MLEALLNVEQIKDCESGHDFSTLGEYWSVFSSGVGYGCRSFAGLYCVGWGLCADGGGCDRGYVPTEDAPDASCQKPASVDLGSDRIFIFQRHYVCVVSGRASAGNCGLVLGHGHDDSDRRKVQNLGVGLKNTYF